MDNRKYMIVIKGEIVTNSVEKCFFHRENRKCDITYTNGRTYTYGAGNVIFMTEPTLLDPKNYIVKTANGKTLNRMEFIYEFQSENEVFWHIVFESCELDFRKTDLFVEENCLTNPVSHDTFEYIREVSALSDLRNDKNEKILKKHMDSIQFVDESTALSRFLNPKSGLRKQKNESVIFPFGCNQSQYQAVKNALENQISVIQGPPGTGKTQTILNIIANLLLEKKTVLVVSNNNSATSNILEKLADEKYGMDFLAASLGSFENKRKFIQNQTGKYPDLTEWEKNQEDAIDIAEIGAIEEKIQNVYRLQEEIARLKERKYEIEIEYRHFAEYAKASDRKYELKHFRKDESADRIMRLWQLLQMRADQNKSLSVWLIIRCVVGAGIYDWEFYRRGLTFMISVLQDKYYRQSLRELDEELSSKEKQLREEKKDYSEQLERKSLMFIRQILASRINWRVDRRVFTEEDLYYNAEEVLRAYPIVLSTTFSARTSLNADKVMYDYLIMDEASQVDIATGVLALSCAKNAVIVGDLKQLPNVVDEDTKRRAELIREKYAIHKAYDFAEKSFLQSVIEAIPKAPQVLLKEHYRCHPRIISFCNQKFYNNELVVMTEDDNLNRSIKVIKTPEGNHRRGNYSQCQIDIIKKEILPEIDVPMDKIGIIAPYNEQVNEIRKQIPGIDAATVHQFQGREKDVIILSTVDDQIKDFTDDPFLLNVAVSRAKKRLIVIVSGNEQERQGNISDLVSYIQYNRMEVVNSRLFSIFYYLYSQYTRKRFEFLKGHSKVSGYESENLTYALIDKILKEYPMYAVTCFIPLSMILKDQSRLSDEEKRYVMNPGTHLDFVIFHKMSRQPVLAIETDGYGYHKEGTAQSERDLKKNHILEMYGLKLLRLSTNGSQEKERIISELDKTKQ
ncbi:Superfamily I DNA and/or RNA helicase [[Clostridium] aminophilum]|uniref:Superfamily I DNA and/or RNA helicase n=1 Tax=[Clostridium] aminophilum TaxID=1526 RepID=A0A1I0A7R4_9FIRM|nr:AAA domain-containing protein [[Clostridium] aminophilum]SES90208.1 Superfamily I DNA and/or RNA helicase [[Clostridium] aminophilum]